MLYKYVKSIRGIRGYEVVDSVGVGLGPSARTIWLLRSGDKWAVAVERPDYGDVEV